MMRYFEMTILVGITAGLRHIQDICRPNSLPSVAWVLLLAAILGARMVLPAEAALASTPYQGMKINNGDIGVMLWGPNNRLTFNVAKADVWDRRWYGHKGPIITLADLKEMAKTGDFPGPGHQPYCAYDFPCPKPVGQLIIGLPGAEAEWTVEGQRAGPGVLTLTAIRGEERLDLRVYVHAARNLIVFEGDAHQGIDGLWFRLYRHRDTLVLGKVDPTLGKTASQTYDYSQDEGNGPMDPPAAGHEGQLGWVKQLFPAELTFPEGFRYTFAALTSAAGVRVESVEGRRGLGTPAHSDYEWEEGETWHRGKSLRLLTHYRPINNAPGVATTFYLPRLEGKFQILATVATSTESTDTLTLARSRLHEALPESPEERFATHQAATKDLRYPYLTRKPGGYYGAIPPCSVSCLGGAQYCSMDSSAWHADFHFNEFITDGYFIGNRIAQLEPYYQLIEQLLPGAQKNAREVYDMPGAMFTMNHFPIRIDRLIGSGRVGWLQSMGISGLITKPFWQHYLYTGDEEFLRNRGYPIFSEVARFYAAYVTSEEDGYYHICPTVSPEHWGLTKDFERNKDCQSALTFFKYILRAAAQAAEVLGVDEEERENWAHIAANMAPYPTYETPDGPIFVDVLGAPPIEYNIPVPLSAVFWGDDITLESPPELVAIALRTIQQIKATHGPVGLFGARALLGGSPHHLQSRGGWDMVKKRGGWIRVFSGIPDNYNASFRNQLAIGAFEVDSACKNGTVTELTIRSRVGNTCQLINPWPDQVLLVKEAEGGGTGRLTGERVRFPTRAGHTYLIEPATP